LKILGAHSIIGGITLHNDSSIKLHEKFGFKKVAEFEEIGFKFGKWLNVGYWQLDID
jgi:phosphinothricin acetyltransferase